jgi:hypothetical protein
MVIYGSVMNVGLVRDMKFHDLTANFEVTTLTVMSGGASGYKSGKGTRVNL